MTAGWTVALGLAGLVAGAAAASAQSNNPVDQNAMMRFCTETPAACEGAGWTPNLPPEKARELGDSLSTLYRAWQQGEAQRKGPRTPYAVETFMAGATGVEIRRRFTSDSTVAARVTPGRTGLRVEQCRKGIGADDRDWCYVSIAGAAGYALSTQLRGEKTGLPPHLRDTPVYREKVGLKP